MMRIAVTGSMGQVATSLIEQAGREFEIVLLGRRVFLLEDRAAVLAGLKAARPDVVINAAARVREEASRALRGVFHMTGSGEATWADFAEAIFVEAAARGRRLTRVKRITTADYPTTRRPRGVQPTRASTMKS